jgi:hypothetical protein
MMNDCRTINACGMESVGSGNAHYLGIDTARSIRKDISATETHGRDSKSKYFHFHH